jgi:SSS family transporter
VSAPAAILFLVLVAVTLGITYWAGKRNKSVESHLVAKGAISGRANGVAIAGDFISAATFLGTTGAIALGGFNGFYLAVYIPIAYLLCMLLVAEPLRNLGKFTLGDVLATRFPGNNVRGVIATASIVVSLLYIVAQFVGAALLIQLLFGIEYWIAAVAIGVLTLVYTLFGGMIATTYIQIVKTAILLFCGALLLVLVLSKFGWNPMNVFQQAAGALPNNKAILPTRAGTVPQWEQFSMIFGVTLGVLGLPHVMIRFLTVKNGAEARTSAVSAIWIFAVFLITLPVLSYGAMLLVGQAEIKKKSAGGNLAVPQLSNLLGGDLLLSFVSAVAFATILAALSGLVIATTGSVSHDLYAKLLMKGDVEHHAQLRIARLATVVSVLVPALIALAAQKQNVAFLATLAIAVAASSKPAGAALHDLLAAGHRHRGRGGHGRGPRDRHRDHLHEPGLPVGGLCAHQAEQPGHLLHPGRLPRDVAGLAGDAAEGRGARARRRTVRAHPHPGGHGLRPAGAAGPRRGGPGRGASGLTLSHTVPPGRSTRASTGPGALGRTHDEQFGPHHSADEDHPPRAHGWPRGRIHYGWIVAVLGMATTFASLGVARFSLGMLLPAMRTDLNLSYTDMGLISTGNFVGYLVAALVCGRIVRVFGARTVIVGGLVMIAVSLLLVASASSVALVWPFYLVTGPRIRYGVRRRLRAHSALVLPPACGAGRPASS